MRNEKRDRSVRVKDMNEENCAIQRFKSKWGELPRIIFKKNS